jgi:hypothetical protein
MILSDSGRGHAVQQNLTVHAQQSGFPQLRHLRREGRHYRLEAHGSVVGINVQCKSQRGTFGGREFHTGFLNAPAVSFFGLLWVSHALILREVSV